MNAYTLFNCALSNLSIPEGPDFDLRVVDLPTPEVWRGRSF